MWQPLIPGALLVHCSLWHAKMSTVCSRLRHRLSRREKNTNRINKEPG